ncbi:hypothetical protein LI82_05145 [Methanococcoides methylutens]|uniref:Uncharacterized protein n=1 Tax=Methanococcoides methylutens TaxID=2226 RepID=A0A099T2H5_METMT|nr:hypothetical protein [Methanococcoides methylutens]KGK99385.1 hypothetical protein LI82_05145 [Methanococcoides methylutens]
MSSTLYFYALAVWVLFVFLAIINGTLRGLYAPYAGELLAHQISSVIFSTVIFAVTYVFLKYSGVAGIPVQFIYVGLMWLFLTISFEFLFGHFVIGHSWERLLHDYNFLQGRIWLLVLIVTAISPWLANRILS